MIGPDSLLRLVFPSDPQVSPDGQSVAYVLTRIEEEDPERPDPEFARPRYRSAIHVARRDGTARQVTSGTKRDTSPRWSPDGRQLAFLSDRTGKPQVYLLPLDGGEPRQLTRLRNGVGEPRWSPDGRHLAVLSRGDTQDRRPERGEARVITRLPYKSNDAGFVPEVPAALYVVEVGSGTVRQLHQPDLSISDVAWAPDGSRLLFVSSTDEMAAALWQQELFEVDLEGQVRQRTRWASAIGGIAPHPDGQQVAFLGRPMDKRNVEDPHVFVFDADGNGRRLDAHVDVPAANMVAGDCHVGSFPNRPAWLDQTLVMSYTVGGSCGLFDLDGEGGHAPRQYTEGRVVSAFTVNARGLATIEESDHEYPEVYLDGQKVTDCASCLGDIPRRRAERVAVRNEAGQTVEGWVLRHENEGLPALLSIHGGPHTAYGHGFMHEFQLLADQGYAVCYSNPRGSVGYGQAFSEAIFGRWGTVDQQDLLAFFDACLERFPDLDRDRTAVMGGSYGGYMTNWLIGHTDRFRAAITDRSICNLVSFNGTSDIGARFWHDELGLEFTRSAEIEGLWHMSPLKYVENVSTPCLIVHSEEDHRCPVEQAEQWYLALRLRGVETRFVRFPEENHELSRSGRPDRRIKRLEEYLHWLDSHLGVGG